MEGIAHGVHIGPGFDQDSSSSSSRAPPNAAVAAALSVVQQDNALSRRAKDLASSFGAGAFSSKARAAVLALQVAGVAAVPAG